ncbi:AAA family ATPase [Moraxella bovis]|uniref:AAA family ATPase n=1 Tax=Moraxella bovis TaxID=476 RepID=UPI002227F9B0|nr:AAA family ATPase [Moraxella bovis]UYZ69204.1 AAA family ATPase [Moraxella bovis]UYZ71577.1 AAA family ATPase [Moraxella bovis]UYZ72509.1 AAA family ATPase [Moraxella bovis]UZA14872.1 AAA family ATPase [Moraxella bovis]UZA26766.1 AAA family ATPase [Moraxella bovis]
MNKWQILGLKGVGCVELELDSNQRVFTFLGTNGVGKTKTLEALFWFLLHQTQDVCNLSIMHSLFSEISLNGEFIQGLHSRIAINKFSAIAYLGANKRSDVFKNLNLEEDIFNKHINYYLGQVDEAIENQTLNEIGMNQNIHKWFTERAKSVNPYQKEKDNRKIDIDTVLNALNILDNRIEKTLKIDGNNNVFLIIEGQERELSELSSGFISVVKIVQSIISSYSAFTNANNLLDIKGVVLIDEIESHLHSEWQIKIIPTLKNLFPNTIFYIATHSPLVLSQLNEGEAYLLKRDDDNVVRSHLINSPNTRLLEDVLQDAFGVHLNALKRKNMANIDQSKAKKKLLELLNSQVS